MIVISLGNEWGIFIYYLYFKSAKRETTHVNQISNHSQVDSRKGETQPNFQRPTKHSSSLFDLPESLTKTKSMITSFNSSPPLQQTTTMLSNIFDRHSRYQSLPEERPVGKPEARKRNSASVMRSSNHKVPIAEGFCQRARPVELMRARSLRYMRSQ